MRTALQSKPLRILAITLLAMLGVVATVLSVLGASWRTPAPLASRFSVPSVALPVAPAEVPMLSPGPCGGFSELPLAPAVFMLGDRVRVPGLAGAADAKPENRLDGLLSPDSSESLNLQIEDSELTIRARETYQRPGSDLFAGVSARADGAAVVTRPSLAGGDVVIRFPKPPTDEDDDPDHDVHLFDAFIRTKDEMVIELGFFVRQAAAEQGGCEHVALRMAEAATSGSRALSMQAGSHQLFDDLALDVPADHAITVRDDGHFGIEVLVHRVVDIAAAPPIVMFRFDQHAGRRELGDLPSMSVMGLAYGKLAAWRQWTEAGGELWRDVMLDKGPRGRVVIAIGAEDEATLDSLGEIAGGLTHQSVKPPLLGCSHFAKPGPAAKPRVDEHLEALLEARQLAVDSEVWGAPRPRELDAFRAIATRPHHDRAAAFRHLAEHGTAAGRIYGLAGLYFADPANFNPVLCAVWGELTGSVEVGLECGPSSKQVAELVESSAANAIRGERFWSGFQFSGAGAADIGGGALAYRIWSHALRGEQSVLAPDGYVPVVTPGAAEPAPLTAGTVASTKIAYSDASLCFTRQDGRIVCVGEVWALPKQLKGGAERVFLLPDMVRFPADIAIGGDSVCVLDVQGRRACVGQIERALEWRYEKCDVAVPETPVYRVFEDGPWSRLLTIGNEVCGVRESDAALYCFTEDGAVGEGQGLYRAYHVPIEGRVVGGGTSVSSHTRQTLLYAFTEDGALWRWHRDEAPTIAGTFEAPVERIAHVGGTDFVSLSGGKVFARGLANDDDPFARGDASQTKWIEIGSLRWSIIHASVAPYHQLGCSLDASGTVGCWGDRREGVVGRMDEVDSLQGSTELHLASFLACGRTSETTLSCSGEGVQWMVGQDGTLAAITLDLDALGLAPPELLPPDRMHTSLDLLARIRSSSTLERQSLWGP